MATRSRAPFFHRADLLFVGILLAALWVRVQFATTVAYIHDEENTTIPLAELISFDAERLNLPIRAVNHPALPAYFVKLGSSLTERTRLGYRSAHIAGSLCTIVLIYAVTRRWYGPVAAGWAALLLAFNEYYLAISARATAHAPYLLFVAAAVYAFSRFLASGRTRYLYLTTAAVGIGFYAKEHIVLLLPAFLLTLLFTSHRRHLRSPQPYLACALLALLVVPDLVWNLRADPDVDRVTYGRRDVAQATYGRHLQRIGGVAFSPYPFVFYGRSAVSALYRSVTGTTLDDNTGEYAAMNPVLGVILLGGVVLALVWRPIRDDLHRFLLLYFAVVFGLFSLIKPGNPSGLDPVSWIWVDATLLPAAVLTGVQLARITGWWRGVGWMCTAAAVGYAIVQTLRAS